MEPQENKTSDNILNTQSIQDKHKKQEMYAKIRVGYQTIYLPYNDAIAVLKSLEKAIYLDLSYGDNPIKLEESPESVFNSVPFETVAAYIFAAQNGMTHKQIQEVLKNAKSE